MFDGFLYRQRLNWHTVPLYLKSILYNRIMNQFLYTIETPAKTIGGDVYTNDLETAENGCIEWASDYGYSCVRNNVTGEIVFDYGDIFEMVEQGIV